MGFSKVASRASNKLQKGVSIANKVVGKAPAILDKTSDILGKVSSVSGKILNNPITAGIVASNPELLPAYGLAIGASKLIGQGSKLASKGADVASKTSNVLEKVNSASSKPAISFA